MTKPDVNWGKLSPDENQLFTGMFFPSDVRLTLCLVVRTNCTLLVKWLWPPETGETRCALPGQSWQGLGDG